MEFERRLREGNGTVVLDVRSAEEFADWHVDGSSNLINLPESTLESSQDALSEIAADTELNVICAAGNASRRVTEKLIADGRKAVNVDGGMIAWSRLLESEEIQVEGPFTVIQFRRESRGCLSYMIICGDEAMVVDPSPDPAPYIAEAEKRGTEIVACFDTHVHADHVSGAHQLAEETGVRVLMPRGSLERGLERSDVELVDDGAEIPLGGEVVEAVALPGHTTEMTGLRFGNAIVTGDSLFANSIARPDLQHPDPDAARAAAGDLYLTLTSRILTNPDATVVLPGHYPGGRLDGPVAPTLGEVKASVTELSLGAEPFGDWVVADLPEKPSNHETIISVNLGTGDVEPDDLGRLETGGNSCAAR